MKMKKMMTTALISTIALGAAMPALALDANQAGSKGSVEFGTGGEDPTPVDPTDPTVPPAVIVPELPGEGGGSTGLLRFDRVPNLKFEKITVSNKAETSKVLEEKYELEVAPTAPATKVFHAAPTVEISDLRGTNAGWHAQVSIGEFFTDKADPTSKIVGKVSFSAGRVTDYSGQSATTPPAVAPTSNAVAELNGSNKTFVNAASGSGAYQWGVSYYTGDHANQGKPKPNYTGTPVADEAIKLTVAPGQNVNLGTGHTYETDITWTLLATPEAP